MWGGENTLLQRVSYIVQYFGITMVSEEEAESPIHCWQKPTQVVIKYLPYFTFFSRDGERKSFMEQLMSSISLGEYGCELYSSRGWSLNQNTHTFLSFQCINLYELTECKFGVYPVACKVRILVTYLMFYHSDHCIPVLMWAAVIYISLKFVSGFILA